MPRPMHFEIPVDDADRAAAFYEQAFGWEIQQWEGAPYWLVTSGPDEEPGINGALGPRGENFMAPMFVIAVDDIEAAMKTVEQAGAKIVVDKSPIPGVGWSAYFTDTEGNQMGLFEDDTSVTMD